MLPRPVSKTIPSRFFFSDSVISSRRAAVWSNRLGRENPAEPNDAPDRRGTTALRVSLFPQQRRQVSGPHGCHRDDMFYWSSILKCGTLYIFRPNSDRTKQRLTLKGLSAAGTYQIHSAAMREVYVCLIASH
jgi:hypothetical protein